jgi:dipeptidyl aminopeptidase/acylaminoacyl peptidase
MPGQNPYKRFFQIVMLLFPFLRVAGYIDHSFATQQTSLIPLENFFKNPARTSFEISPDGKHIAYLESWQNRLNVYIQKVNNGDKPVRVTHSTHRDIMWFGWANNRRIAYIQDKDGDENWQAGFKEWGKKMLDDVTDGVQWLIKEGIADPERTGIYGASFGGYTALASLTFTPDLYV